MRTPAGDHHPRRTQVGGSRTGGTGGGQEVEVGEAKSIYTQPTYSGKASVLCHTKKVVRAVDGRWEGSRDVPRGCLLPGPWKTVPSKAPAHRPRYRSDLSISSEKGRGRRKNGKKRKREPFHRRDFLVDDDVRGSTSYQTWEAQRREVRTQSSAVLREEKPSQRFLRT